ncbi:MFS transporter [Patescibacteria group bacterium]
MHLFHFYHTHKLHKLSLSDFWIYELSIWLQTFARSLIAIFIPILLLKTGYSIQQVIIYYLIYNVIDVPLNFLAHSLIKKIGARVSICFAIIATIIFFIILLNLTSNSWPALFAMALFAAIYDSFYWVAHIYLFIISSSSNNKVSRNAGILHAVKTSATLLGPIIGAAILIIANQQLAIILSIIFYLISLIPLYYINTFDDKTRFSTLKLSSFFQLPSTKKTFTSTILYSIHSTAESTLFPIFIFLTLNTIESVAIISVVISITTIFLSIILGRLASPKQEIVIASGAFFLTVVWVLRIIFSNTIFYYISISVVSILSYFILIPIDSQIFSIGRHKDALAASTYRNASHMATNVIIFSILAVVVNIFKVNFIQAATAMFILFALSIFGQLQTNLTKRQ